MSRGIHFETKELATDLRGGYQVIATDVNHDGKPDLVALASGIKDLNWFENPTWQRHVLASGLSRMINTAPLDANGDGVPEFLIAHEFANVAAKSLGILSLAESSGDWRQPFKLREIDRIPTSHRLRVLRLAGGKLAIVNAPLSNGNAVPPDYRGPVPLVLYRPPDWKREPILQSIEGVMHGISVFDWDGDGADEILTASFDGLHLLRRAKDGQWKAEKLSAGDPAPWPKSGSSEVAVGRLGKQRFLASIDPWHGNQVAVYRKHGKTWTREVIDSAEEAGHTLHTADFDGDGNDEIIAGFRGSRSGVFLYRWDPKAKRWNKQPVDNKGMTASGCAVADFNGDKRVDLACIGSTTANLRLYTSLP